MATTTQIRARLALLMLAAPGNLTHLERYANPNDPLNTDDLPGFFIGRAGRAEHENTAGSELFTTRRWLIWVVVNEIEDDTITAKETSEDEAEAYLDDIIWYLRSHLALDLVGTDAGLSGVQGISIKDDGIKEYERSTKRYNAIPIMLDVASYRSG